MPPVTCTTTVDGQTYTAAGRDLYTAARRLAKLLRKARAKATKTNARSDT